MDQNNIFFAKNPDGTISNVSSISANTILTMPRSLNKLADTNIVGPLVNQSLLYNSTTGKWDNSYLTFANLADVLITSPDNNQYVRWDYTVSKYINRLNQNCSINFSGKFNDALFPSITGVNLLNTANFTSIDTNTQFTQGGITIDNTTGQISGLANNRYYLFTARLNITMSSSPTSTNFILTIKGSTGTEYARAIMSSNNQSKTISLSVVSFNTFAIGATVPTISVNIIQGSSGYVGLSPTDMNLTFTLQEI